MRVQITGKVVKSEKKKPDSKMFTTQVLQTGGAKADLITIYTPEQFKDGDVTLECNISLNSWKDRNGTERFSIMVSQVKDTPANAINPLKRAV